MNTCESRRHYVKYYKTYILNQHSNFSVILEWQRQFQSVSHKKNFNQSCNIFDFQVNYMFYWHVHFDNEIPINCVFTQWKWNIHIMDFGPWRWSAVNMTFVIKRPSRMQGQCFFFEIGRDGQQFSVGFKNFPGRLPLPRSRNPWKFVWGCSMSAMKEGLITNILYSCGSALWTTQGTRFIVSRNWCPGLRASPVALGAAPCKPKPIFWLT